MQEDNKEWVDQTITVKESIYIIVHQCVNNFTKSVSNPINWLYGHTGKLHTVTDYTHKVKHNCKTARDFIANYVDERRRGVRQSALKDKSDILSLMLDN